MGEKHKKTGKPSRGIWDNVRFMAILARRNRPSVLWFCPALAACAILHSATQMLMIPAVLDAVEKDSAVSRLSGIILLFTAVLIAVTAGRAYLGSASTFGRVELRLELAAMIQHKTLTMSYPLVEDADVRKKKDKAAMLISGNQCSTETIWSTLTDLLRSGAEFLICLSLLSSLRPVLILIVLGTTLVSYLVSSYLNAWSFRHRDEEAAYSRRMNYLSERSRDYTLAKDVRIFGLAGWIGEVFDSTLRLYRDFTARSERIGLLGNVFDTAMTLLRGGAVYSFLIGAVLRGDMSAPQFVLLSNAVQIFSAGIGSIMNNCSVLRRQCLDISAVREFLDYPEPFRMEDGTPLSPDPDADYEIRLRDVSFRYPGAEQDTLSHIDLTLRPGEKLAVVGLNGAGKTTLIKLMCGLLEPTDGQVLLNGTDIRGFHRPDYYRLFSAVFQNYSVLEVSVAENIAQTDEGIDTEKLERCVDRAGLRQKIDSLPNGVRTHLGKVFEDGIELSGGELQRLMLARALYKDAPILLLDEPTSALDPLAESEIYQRYSELTAGRSAVYISHRLASTRFCDRILLIADGGIAEEGTHEELLARNGRYASLFELQSRYYREGGEEDAGNAASDPAGI